MPTLHDPGYREAIKSRIKAVTPNALPKWGSMTVDQMMWHLCAGIEVCLGRLDLRGEKPSFPIPKPLLRFVVLNLPWPKGSPTLRVTKAAGQHDLEAERARCLKLIDEFASRQLDDAWHLHPALGAMSGEQYSRLQAKHFNHHLAQFGE
ncbi:MAG: DinB family protein [Acidobacteria bacterium]|nr:DinB family protein [Acidobacteriota bacterium]